VERARYLDSTKVVRTTHRARRCTWRDRGVLPGLKRRRARACTTARNELWSILASLGSRACAKQQSQSSSFTLLYCELACGYTTRVYEQNRKWEGAGLLLKCSKKMCPCVRRPPVRQQRNDVYYHSDPVPAALRFYTFLTGLSTGPHEIRIFKTIEPQWGSKVSDVDDATFIY